VLGNHRPTMRAYRFAVRSFLPRIAYAETLLYRKRLPPDAPSPALDELNAEIARLAAEEHWNQYRRHAGFGTHLLAGLIFILPKVGPLSDLSLRGPAPATEQRYLDSVVQTIARMRSLIQNATKSDGIPNLDLDTGIPTKPGSYRLADDTYAELLHAVTRDPATPVPFGIKRDLTAYYADPNAPIVTKKDPAKWAQVQSDLVTLQAISTHAAYPETAFLPEPESARPQ
jgi:hypothetical protein